METSKIKVIEIMWEGPYTDEQVLTLKGNTDWGVYQVYGNHRVYGRGVLLYIGKAVEDAQKFGVRIPQHNDWFGWKGAELSYYVGRFGAEAQADYQGWIDEINYSEAMLIDYCQPAWNSSGLNNTKRTALYPNAIIYNHGMRRDLPEKLAEIEDIKTAESRNVWQPYVGK